jgi:hypothetical protein
MRRKLLLCDKLNNIHSVEGVFCIHETTDKFPCPEYSFGGQKRGSNMLFLGYLPQNWYQNAKKVTFM